MDTVADRDVHLEFAAACALFGVHLSRIAEDLILWMSSEFAFVDLPDAFCTGSSLMPQKKNPDACELLRGKSARLHGNLQTLLTLAKGLPLTYNRDLQEDKPAVFDSFEQAGLCADVLAGTVTGLTVKHAHCAAAVSDPALLATDLAILVWDPTDERTVRISLPFWVLKLGRRKIDIGNSGGFDFERLNIDVDQLEKIGPRLLVDVQRPGGERVLVWSDAAGRTPAVQVDGDALPLLPWQVTLRPLPDRYRLFPGEVSFVANDPKAGAITFVVETASRRPGLACGIVFCLVNGGVLLAALVNLALQSWLPPATMAEYGWRIAFLFGGVVGLVSFVLRRSLEETPEFLRLQHRAARRPIGEVLRHHRGPVLVGIGVVALTAGFNGILFAHMPAYLIQVPKYPPREVALAMNVALFAMSASLLFASFFADRVPPRRLMQASALIVLIGVIPAYQVLARGGANLFVVLPLLTMAVAGANGSFAFLLGRLENAWHNRDIARGILRNSTATRTNVTLQYDDNFYLRPGRITVTDGVTGRPVDPYDINTYALSTAGASPQTSRNVQQTAFANVRRSFGGALPLTLTCRRSLGGYRTLGGSLRIR